MFWGEREKEKTMNVREMITGQLPPNQGLSPNPSFVP